MTASRDNCIRQRVQSHFNRRAKAYDENTLLADPSNLDAVIRMAGIDRGSRALDVATGTGFLAERLSRAGADVVALDLVLGMLRQARVRSVGRVDFVRADIETIPFGNGAFDTVTCRVALHHFPDPIRALAEMARVCRCGGRMVLTDIVSSEDTTRSRYHNRMEKLRDVSHVRHYSLPELKQMMSGVGLSITRTDTWRYSWEVESWLKIADPPEENAKLIRGMMRRSLGVDRSGLEVEERDGRLYFTYTIALILAQV